LIFGRKSLAGSVVGGMAETQHVIDRAYERAVNKDVRYRFVITGPSVWPAAQARR
jgi:D-arabinose 1-dehydrogenase-like Zn-dependent alcohol dehydrogenase